MADRAEDLPGGERDGEDEREDAADAPAPGRRVWWPAVAAALVALCLAVAAVLVYAGDDGSSSPGDGSVEAGFTRDMIVHHQQAVEMAFIVRDDTQDEEVRRLAYDIANTQANQRGMMLGWLDVWGLTPTSSAKPMAWMGGGHADFTPKDGALMPGMATNAQIEQLRRARGRDAEILFLRLMIPHHRGGVEMAQAAQNMSDNEQVDRLAGTIVQGQKSEIDLMNDMLKRRGAAPVE